ncbi:response regulator transcription factor [Cecembia rubra]|uniref:response regulator transcription factor n=1 Tax=Cecembia rubra TaxID=1485585 RepID=UPI00271455B5|nr:helix-turn-helix transcriptional regulator [Cecembia rubra]
MKILNSLSARNFLVLIMIILFSQLGFGQADTRNLTIILKDIPFKTNNIKLQEYLGAKLNDLKYDNLNYDQLSSGYGEILKGHKVIEIDNPNQFQEIKLPYEHIVHDKLIFNLFTILLFSLLGIMLYFHRFRLQKKEISPFQNSQPIFLNNDLDFKKINSKLLSPLTNRESEIVTLVEEGLTNHEIASKLFVSENTVKTHLKNIFIKTNAINRTDLIHKLRRF